MNYLFVKQKITDFKRWHKVFKSHGEARENAGLINLKLMKVLDEPKTIVCLFEVESIDLARSFTSSQHVGDIRNEAGVIGIPEVLFLEAI